MFEIPVPADWAGRTVGKIDIRKRFKINIMGVKTGGRLDLSISSDTVLGEGETLLVLGRNKDIQKCFHL